jgi:hypothetical protein
MGRLLLHYDIEHDDTRGVFQVSITNPPFNPIFQEVTESVYETDMPTTQANLDALVQKIRNILGPQPYPNTRVFIEYAGSENGRPSIIQVVAVDA